MDKKLILITNDDGISSKGIEILTRVACIFGDVVVIAPDKGRSGMSHAITVSEPIELKDLGQNENIKYFSCTGTPSDCVKLGLHEVLDRKPDLILSGINHGSNTSTSIIYSGTMAGAIEGTLNGIPSIGFSVTDYMPDANFNSAEVIVHHLLTKVLDEGLPEDICLNVNIPAVDADKVKGIKVCRQTKGWWVEEFDKRVNPHGKEYYWLTGKFHNPEPEATDTDEWALNNSFASIVPVKIDFTAHDYLKELKDWNVTLSVHSR